MRLRIVATALSAALSFVPVVAQAWHEKGHMMVAAIAWEQMTPSTRTRASQLLKLNPDYDRWVGHLLEGSLKDKLAFMRASVWPDDIKGRNDYQDDGDRPPAQGASLNIGYSDKRMHKYWHYKSHPLQVGNAAIAQPPSPNAETQIIAFRDTIASATASDEVKSYDVAWLIHLVGDVHQPLHATSRFTKFHKPPSGDRGGNGVTLSCCGGSLHTFWDAAIGDSNDHNVAILAAAVLPAAPASAVANANPASWLVESFVIARQKVYRSPIGTGKGPFNLTSLYKDEARTIAGRRIALAGARLAKLFNDHLK
jgi:hypothetical protein